MRIAVILPKYLRVAETARTAIALWQIYLGFDAELLAMRATVGSVEFPSRCD